MNKLVSPITEIGTRYPNLTRACQWVGSLTNSEARLVVWAQKNRIPGPIGGERVALFGGPKQLIQQAVRTRNY